MTRQSVLDRLPEAPWPPGSEPGLVLLRVTPSERPSIWLALSAPERILCTDDITQVRPLLAEAEAAARDGCIVAGLLRYEAAPAFDPALCVHHSGAGPLLWFGVYRKAHRVVPMPVVNGDAAIADLRWSASMQEPEYCAAIARIKEYIAAGDTYQVNYTLRLSAAFRGDPLALFGCLVAAQPKCYGAYLDCGDEVICSVSPELFFRLDGDHLTFKPMKGTVRRGPYAVPDAAQARWLRASPKNRAENLMIVDMIRNDASRIAEPGSVAVPRLFEVERYPTLWQMTSTVTARTDASVAAILDATFPCASITGAPKVRTMQIIHELEATPRGIYTGAIGYLAPEREAQFNVAIRTVAIDRARGEACYGTGGGIVADSEAVAEYNECRAKGLVLIAAAQPFALLETLRWTPNEGFHLLREHLDRLSASAAYFDISLDAAAVPAALAAAVAGSDGAQRVRLLVDRSGRISTETQPFTPSAATSVLRVALAPEPISSSDVFLYHKTTRRAVYEAARAARPDCDEVLLWNERGELTEFTTGNLLVQRGATTITPPHSCGLLAGTERRALLDRGELHEAVIHRDELPACDALYFINSVRGRIRVQVIT
ncbi:MAG: aminodeoxychorismate synthase component I [Gammaproteobacteria bacterium]|nr:aminodeoxychorismate synthase component I [Gammaproteobacteria bacterium]